MIEGLIAGKVCGRPERRVGNSSGRPFVTAKVRAAGSDGEAVFVNVRAFDVSAQTALLALADGDAVTLAGTMTPKAWTDREGAARPALDLVASQVLTVYHLKRRRDMMAAATAAPPPVPPRAAAPAAPRQQELIPAVVAGAGFEVDEDEWLTGGAR